MTGQNFMVDLMSKLPTTGQEFKKPEFNKSKLKLLFYLSKCSKPQTVLQISYQTGLSRHYVKNAVRSFSRKYKDKRFHTLLSFVPVYDGFQALLAYKLRSSGHTRLTWHSVNRRKRYELALNELASYRDSVGLSNMCRGTSESELIMEHYNSLPGVDRVEYLNALALRGYVIDFINAPVKANSVEGRELARSYLRSKGYKSG